MNLNGLKVSLLIFIVLMGCKAHAEPRVLMVLGDSLSSGYGIDAQQGWVNLLQQRLRRQGHQLQVINASISGDTTRSGLSRLPQALARHQPEIVIVELGGNDGLRGLELEETQKNLEAITKTIKASGAQVLLVGMRLPPNLGPRYTAQFHRLYGTVADRLHIPLVPFLLEGVAVDPELMQADGIHPRAKAQPKILDNLWPHLAPML